MEKTYAVFAASGTQIALGWCVCGVLLLSSAILWMRSHDVYVSGGSIGQLSFQLSNIDGKESGYNSVCSSESKVRAKSPPGELGTPPNHSLPSSAGPGSERCGW